MINQKGISKTTILTVCNYDRYQKSQPTDNQQITNSQPTDNQQITTSKEYNNINNINKEIIIGKPAKVKKKVTKFIKPTIEEISDYVKHKKYYNIDAKYFYDYYEDNDWKKNNRQKIKNWKLTIDGWARRNYNNNNSSYSSNNSNVPISPYSPNAI